MSRKSDLFKKCLVKIKEYRLASEEIDKLGKYLVDRIYDTILTKDQLKLLNSIPKDNIKNPLALDIRDWRRNLIENNKDKYISELSINISYEYTDYDSKWYNHFNFLFLANYKKEGFDYIPNLITTDLEKIKINYPEIYENIKSSIIIIDNYLNILKEKINLLEDFCDTVSLVLTDSDFKKLFESSICKF